MMTRQDYMNTPRIDANGNYDPAIGAELHRRYYGEIVAAIWPNGDAPLPCGLDRIRAALATSDDTLRTIPLAAWDHVAMNTRRATEPELRKRGDSWSLGTGVCIAKEAARIAAVKGA